MKIITIEEEAWQLLNSRIDTIADYLKRKEDNSNNDLWLTKHEVCQYLHISEKTLWHMQTKCESANSKICDHCFYAIGAIKDMLNAVPYRAVMNWCRSLWKKAKATSKKAGNSRQTKNRYEDIKIYPYEY